MTMSPIGPREAMLCGRISWPNSTFCESPRMASVSKGDRNFVMCASGRRLVHLAYQ